MSGLASHHVAHIHKVVSSMPPPIADTPSGEDLGGPVIVDISHPGAI